MDDMDLILSIFHIIIYINDGYTIRVSFDIYKYLQIHGL